MNESDGAVERCQVRGRREVEAEAVAEVDGGLRNEKRGIGSVDIHGPRSSRRIQRRRHEAVRCEACEACGVCGLRSGDARCD